MSNSRLNEAPGEADRKASRADRTTEQQADLLATINDQIVPRLLLAHAPEELEPRCAETRLPPTDAEIHELAELAVGQNMATVLALIESLSREGLSLESLLLDLVAPAGRLLGEQWLDDERSFVDVSLGLGTLQRVVAVLGSRIDPPISHHGLVVLTTPTEECHSLAVLLLGELLREAGWGTYVALGASVSDLAEIVAREPVVAVGFSVNRDELVPPLAPAIARLKKSSRNPDLMIMLGGTADLTECSRLAGAILCESARQAIDTLAGYARDNR